MNSLGHQNHKKENTETKNLRYDGVISYISEIAKKKRWVVLKKI